MAYIGKQPSTKFSAAAKFDSFTGDGSTTTFDVSNIIPAGGENGIQVYVDNVRQKPGSSNSYTIGNDGSGDLKRITFTAAPDDSAEIYVIVPYEATNIKNVPDGTITNEKIADGAIDNAAISPSAAISDTKLGTISTSGKVATSAISQPGSSGVYLAGDGNWGAIDTSQQDTNAFNIGLLGFKMAVNDGLTVFNLVDGVVDEFNDESGTDEAEGSNDYYCGTTDFYTNNCSPITTSAGFSMTAITEPDTSTTGTNPAFGSGTLGQYTVACGVSTVGVYVWGAGGSAGGAYPCNSSPRVGGGGGFASGCLAVTGGQTLYALAGEGGNGATTNPIPATNAFKFGGNRGTPGDDTGQGMGGGLAGVFTNDIGPQSAPQVSAPGIVLIGGSGGGGGDGQSSDLDGLPANTSGRGGAGGGLTGLRASNTAGTAAIGNAGGGGDQEQGGTAGQGSTSPGQTGSFLTGGNGSPAGHSGGGGAGYYGGGGGARGDFPTGACGSADGAGGGGSTYYGHPQISSGATTAGSVCESGGAANPLYTACTSEGGPFPGSSCTTGARTGEDGYVLITAASSALAQPGGGSTTITSEPFASGTVPTSSRIVVFEENVDTPTLNTDIIASVSRDGGVTFTNATLSDSGYVTGSSGQRILTGQATISGQPSGQSMRWKLALANNTVKIHGVSLQWA